MCIKIKETEQSGWHSKKINSCHDVLNPAEVRPPEWLSEASDFGPGYDLSLWV